MRRTLALAGAAVLAAGVSALPAPASANPSVTDVIINEVGAALDANVDGGFVELRNTTGAPYSLDNHVLQACDASGIETVIEFDSTDEISAHGFFLVGDPNYNPGLGEPSADKTFSEAITLAQSGGGVQLVNGSSPEDDVKWGQAPQDCSSFDPAGVVPDDDESLNNQQPADTWVLAEPTPTSSAS
jgi:hypothetical protein